MQNTVKWATLAFFLNLMKPILPAGSIRLWDTFTIAHEPISSWQLMERAVLALFDQTIQLIDPAKDTVWVFCGPGNNGGDGLGLAYYLHHAHAKVIVVLAGESKTPEQAKSLERVIHAGNIPIFTWPDLPQGTPDVIIDSLMGSGIQGKLHPPFDAIVSYVNGLDVNVISLDLPSGLTREYALVYPVIQARWTLTIGGWKEDLFMAHNEPFLGKVTLVDIGLAADFPPANQATMHLLEQDDITCRLKTRPRFSHKGMNGHAMLIAGSAGMTGAAVLAAEACLRAGCGKLSVHVPASGYPIMQVAIPEAMVSQDIHSQCWSSVPSLDRYQAIGVGCGVGTNALSKRALKLFLAQVTCPIVIDADALNMISEMKREGEQVIFPENAILTPHPGEFHRLLDMADSTCWEDLETLRSFSMHNRVYTLLKGAYTRICTPEGKIYFNPTGNAGMATAGSGDVLTGILTGLLSQGYSPENASIVGVYLHGLAGDIALQNIGSPESLIARDIIHHLGQAFHQTAHAPTK